MATVKLVAMASVAKSPVEKVRPRVDRRSVNVLSLKGQLEAPGSVRGRQSALGRALGMFCLQSPNGRVTCCCSGGHAGGHSP